MKNILKISFFFLAFWLINVPIFSQTPSLTWATYFGGDSFTNGAAMARDSSGNVYICDYTYSFKGIATNGAYKTSGDSASGDAYLAKFSPTGSLIWATYYGGNSYDAAYGVAIDKSGNIYLTGTTYSTSGIATKGAYQTIGDSIYGDAFVAKFNPSGNLLWGTYYGGNSYEEGNGIAADVSGYIYITGTTYSDTGITTLGAYQTKGDSLNGNAYLAKFNSSGGLLWGTYFGGNQIEEGFGIAAKDTNIYIAGYTYSDSGIATKGAYQTYSMGGAYLANFTSAGALLWATYYGEANTAFAVNVDDSRNIYITGDVNSYVNNIATTGAYQTSFGGGIEDAFLAKFSSSGNLTWGTYFGGSSYDAANGLVLDTSGNVYIVGSTRSTSDITTSGAYQTIYGGGNYDAFLAKFSASGNLLWGTYYGGGGDVEGEGIVTDPSGSLYFIGYTESASRIATSGAYQTSLSGFADAFLVKFSTLCSLDLSFKGKDTVCQNAMEKYSAPVNGLNTYTWKAVGGNIASGKNKDTVVVQWNSTGNDTLWLKGVSASCKDSINKVIIVNPLPNAHFTITKQSDATYIFKADDETQSNYNWIFGDGKTGKGDTITHTYLKDSTYQVSLNVKSITGCTSAFDTSLSVLTGIKAIAAFQNDLYVFPNPFTTIISINYSILNYSFVKISITDINGRLITTLMDGKQESGNHDLQFDVDKCNCSSGVYYVKLINGDNVITRPIIKIN